LKARALWPILVATCLVGCVLSPGHDLPSTENSPGGGETPLPGDGDGPPIIGDGDITITPPDANGEGCEGSGGLGGLGGAFCESAEEP
jgi:hypothetical protein